MRILITGATGFIGAAVAKALHNAGHDILAGVRNIPTNSAGYEYVVCDFSRDLEPAIWRERLAHVDMVINAVGIILETKGQAFDSVQQVAPIALFTAAIEQSIPVIQISGLGADQTHCEFDFLASKQAADDFLWLHAKRALIIYPSIVIGSGGASTELFTVLASLPVVPLVGRGDQQINPIHIDELARAVVFLVDKFPEEKQKLFLVGPEVFTLKDLFAALREWAGLGKAHFLPIPMVFMWIFAKISQVLRLSTLTPDSLGMLASAQTPAANISGFTIKSLRECLASTKPSPAEAFAYMAKPWLHLLWIGLVFLWVFTGLTSIYFNVPAGIDLLQKAGLQEPWISVAIYSGGVLDILLGLLMLTRRRWVYGLQLITVLVYMAIVSVILPDMWLDPLGSITKNIPVLIVTAFFFLLPRKYL